MTDAIRELVRKTVVEHLRQKVCVDPDTGLRRLPNYLDDEIFRLAANLLEADAGVLPPQQKTTGGDVYATAPVVLTEWERIRLSQHVASNALTYMAHHARGGLKPAEIEDMRRWNSLSEKLKAPAAATEADHG